MELKITPVDDDKSQRGTWGNYRGVDLLIARGNNPAYTRELRRLQRPYQREIARGTHDMEQFERDVCAAMSKHVLMGWKNFRINGKDIEYTQEHALNLLLNDHDAREYVSAFSLNVDNYMKEEAEATAGNS